MKTKWKYQAANVCTQCGSNVIIGLGHHSIGEIVNCYMCGHGGTVAAREGGLFTVNWDADTDLPEYAGDREEILARLRYDLGAAYESRCDCWDVDRQTADDLTRLIGKLEGKIQELETAA